jgi:two-component system sensor histidine kinase DegS
VASVFGQTLDDIRSAASKAIHTLETRLARLAVDSERHADAVDAERSAAQREREELDIEYSLTVGSQFVLESPEAAAPREREHRLTDEVIRANALHRQLSDFTAFLSATVRRLEDAGDLPDADEAHLAAIRSAAFSAQEQERQRLAREIHDGPAQALANAIVALEFVERAIRASSGPTVERALDEVERIKSSLRDGLTEIRRFIFDLRPTMLQDRGLPQTVEHYIATYQSVFPMAIDFQPAHHLPRLTPDQELTAFRVIQESIQNARKHARAATVSVSINHVDHTLFVVVSDNGRGFSPERVTTHLMGGAGLRGMRERAALIGGTLTIESALGEGTTIILEAPTAIDDDVTPDQPSETSTDSALAGQAATCDRRSVAKASTGRAFGQ